MDPIPVFFDNVNRSALVIKPKKPFFDWLNKIDPLDSELTIGDQSSVYLLPGFEETSKMQAWLRKNFDELFCDQMNNWYIDEALWVKGRTFKLFKEWFDYSFHTFVLDTLDKPVDKF